MPDLKKIGLTLHRAWNRIFIFLKSQKVKVNFFSHQATYILVSAEEKSLTFLNPTLFSVQFFVEFTAWCKY